MTSVVLVSEWPSYFGYAQADQLMILKIPAYSTENIVVDEDYFGLKNHLKEIGQFIIKHIKHARKQKKRKEKKKRLEMFY